jgi:hypothetical protein
MPTFDEYLALPLADRIARLASTPDDIAAAIAGLSDAELSRRAADGWAAKEIVCHFRDVEELVILRYHTMLAEDGPKLLVVGAPPPDAERWGMAGDVPFPLDAARWATERQYLRNDTSEALAAFRQRRREVMALLGALSPQQWQRAAIHPVRGRIALEDWAAGSASHDDNHLAQLREALRA